ncbi:MAG: fumarylacetoacetate hydrolase family protein [Myxococcota bacterium]|nr:fumarylacetoacetate hydrolase family protein [Myxococcota bacterium]
MPLSRSQTDALGDELWSCLQNLRTTSPLTERFPDMSIDDAYAVNLRLRDLRSARGDKEVGKKIGVTSYAVQSMLGVNQPDFGFLFDSMLFENEMPISQHLVAPRAEGELAFMLKEDLCGPGVSDADVLAATQSVIPCFEVVDSRIADWKIKIQDTIADNASCGLYALGEPCSPEGLDFPKLQMKVFKNGELLSEGLGSAALGSPVKCVAWLANTLGKYGIKLKAGDLILSGSWVPLEPVEAGDEMRLEISGLGSCQLRFT